MTSEFTNVTQRSRLSSFIYREGCLFAGWYDNPDFEGEHLHTIHKVEHIMLNGLFVILFIRLQFIIRLID